LLDCKKEAIQEFTNIANTNNGAITISQNYKIDNCFDGFDVALYDKVNHAFVISTSMFFKSSSTNHAIVGVTTILNKDSQSAVKEALDYICIN